VGAAEALAGAPALAGGPLARALPSLRSLGSLRSHGGSDDHLMHELDQARRLALPRPCAKPARGVLSRPVASGSRLRPLYVWHAGYQQCRVRPRHPRKERSSKNRYRLVQVPGQQPVAWSA